MEIYKESIDFANIKSYYQLVDDCVSLFFIDEERELIKNKIKELSKDEIEEITLSDDLRFICNRCPTRDYFYWNNGPDEEWIRKHHQFLEKDNECYLSESLIIQLMIYNDSILDNLKIILEYFNTKEMSNVDFKINLAHQFDPEVTHVDFPFCKIEHLINNIIFFKIWSP